MSPPLDKLTGADFAPLAGSSFRVESAGVEGIDLVLGEVGPAGEGLPGARQPFSLVFAGPLQPVLRQAIHVLVHPALGRLEIFLVPIGPADGRMRYQAIFS
ncbi:MAG: DUF6916 family protein [Acidobacteriota bacterium]